MGVSTFALKNEARAKLILSSAAASVISTFLEYVNNYIHIWRARLARGGNTLHDGWACAVSTFHSLLFKEKNGKAIDKQRKV